MVTTPAAAPRILVVDDAPAMRVALRELLEDAGFAVVGEGADGAEGVALAARLAPDVVLMDLRMPGLNGLEATGQIVAALPGSTVVVFSLFDGPVSEGAALAAGATAFLPKGCPPELICDTLRALTGWNDSPAG
jgi:DNA-binding NarL/FixJ family response regulator